MQICRLHHQRQANHIHTDTHALLQTKDGLGDCQPQAVVISMWIVNLCSWLTEFRIRNITMAELCSTAGPAYISPVLGQTCTPAYLIRNQLCYSASSKLSADGLMLEHQALPPSSLLHFVFIGASMEHQYSN